MDVRQIIGFGVVGFALIVASDFDGSGEIAVAFAYLILLGVVMAAGPIAFDRVSKLVTSKASAEAPRRSPGLGALGGM